MKKAFLILCGGLLGVCARADLVTLKDGSRYEGEVVSEEENTVELKMPIGIIKFHRDEVARVDKISVHKNSVEEEPIPFPAGKKATTKKGEKAANKKAPTKKVKFVEEEEEGEITSEAELPAVEAEVPLDPKKAAELELKEKELEIKRQELELRRQELELKKKEQGAVSETPAKEVEEKTKAAEEESKEENKIKKEEPKKPAEEKKVEGKKEEEKEDTKVKGVPVGPKIQGTGRYKTY